MDDHGSPGKSDPSGTNNDLFERSWWIATSKTLDLQRPVFHDLASINRYLLSQVDLKLTVYRSPVTFALLVKDAITNFMINIDDINVLARKIRANPAVLYGHSKFWRRETSYIPTITGPRSAVGNVSGYRCVSDCRSRGREFKPGPVPYFRGDWSWNNFYGHSPPFRWFIQEGLLSVTRESMCTNYWLTACSSLPRKKCG